MVIQMPVFIFIYQGIRAYTFHFHNAGFLWIKDMSKPDLPLLLMYGVSMFISQKITMAGQPTSGDPSQQQMQKTMSWMMQGMFTYMMFVLKLPSAFYFYWLAFNVLTTLAMFINKRTVPLRAPVATGAPAPVAPTTAGGPLRPVTPRAPGKGGKKRRK
jgi:YidC/Oxa1 family membrane protein insertase